MLMRINCRQEIGTYACILNLQSHLFVLFNTKSTVTKFEWNALRALQRPSGAVRDFVVIGFRIFCIVGHIFGIHLVSLLARVTGLAVPTAPIYF